MVKFDKKFRITGFEHLHLHTTFSLLDGFGFPEEYSERAVKINQKFLCVSDHGMMGAIPRQMRACEVNNLNPIYACELYVNNNHVSRDIIKELSPSEKEKVKHSYHLLALASNDIGYKNLVKLTSWGWLNGFYKKPRVTHEQLLKHKEGLIFTSCCYNSEIGRAFDRGGPDEADQMIEKYMGMFPGQFYLEIMLLDFKKQKPYNSYIIKASEKYGLKLLLTQDCHYPNKEDSQLQRYMLMIRTNTTIKDVMEKASSGDEDVFELQDTNLWMKSEDELNEKWLQSYHDSIPLEVFEQAKAETVRVANLCKGVKLDRGVKLPRFEDADKKLLLCLNNEIKSRNLHIQPGYFARLKEEYNLIKNKGFSSYFLIMKEIIDKAREIAPQIMGWDVADEAVGPARGSAGGSLACYLLGITDIDPMKHNLLFSRFLNENRGGRSMKTRFLQPEI